MARYAVDFSADAYLRRLLLPPDIAAASRQPPFFASDTLPYYAASRQLTPLPPLTLLTLFATPIRFRISHAPPPLASATPLPMPRRHFRHAATPPPIFSRHSHTPPFFSHRLRRRRHHAAIAADFRAHFSLRLR